MDVLFGSFRSKLSNSFCTFKELTKKSQPKDSYVFSYFLTNFTHKFLGKELFSLLKCFSCWGKEFQNENPFTFIYSFEVFANIQRNLI